MTDTPDLKFPSLRKAVAALYNAGYEVSRSKMSRDKKNGLIDFNPDGSVYQKEVEKYARLLKKREAALEDNHEKAAIKADWEIRTLEVKHEKLVFELEKEKGKYIERAMFEAELAARAAILETGLKHYFSSKIQELVALVGGKPEKSPEFMQRINVVVDEELSRYATTKNFHVVFIGDHDATADV
jgi:hypothetical protein